MGIGSLREISLAVANGFDIFDCVLPTRLGRHGTAFFNDERLNLRNARFKNDFSPIDKTCKCETCKSYSRAYLHHLIRNDEILGLSLISLHNIAHLIRFTNAISTAIRDNCFTNDFAPWKTSSIEDSLQRTHSWLQKCVETHQKSNQALFGIVQGGKYPKLREHSAKFTSSFDLPGIAAVSYTHLTLPTKA